MVRRKVVLVSFAGIFLCAFALLYMSCQPPFAFINRLQGKRINSPWIVKAYHAKKGMEYDFYSMMHWLEGGLLPQ